MQPTLTLQTPPTHSHRTLALIVGVVVAVIFALGAYQVRTVTRAHETFENYYAFRGCQQLLSRTDTDGTCRLADGSVIKLVMYEGKWYLDGDLPTGQLFDW